MKHTLLFLRKLFSDVFSFIEWTHEVLSSVTDVLHHFQLLGAVESLAAIFKVCFNYFHFHSHANIFLLVEAFHAS